MNRIIGLVLATLLVSSVAHADVYITTAPSGAVYDVSNQADCVVPSGYTRTLLKGQNIQNLAIIPPYQNYNFSNGAFMLNVAVVQASNTAQVQAANAMALKQAARASAIAKIASADGLTQAEAAAL